MSSWRHLPLAEMPVHTPPRSKEKNQHGKRGGSVWPASCSFHHIIMKLARSFQSRFWKHEKRREEEVVKKKEFPLKAREKGVVLWGGQVWLAIVRGHVPDTKKGVT